jgi:dihydroorotate dehydrogenase (fumarate)
MQMESLIPRFAEPKKPAILGGYPNDKGILMPDLHTSYLGLKLKNPLIVSSSSLTDSVQGIQRLADAGIAAVVLKSLFEEQIEAETNEISDEFPHTEAYDYVRQSGMSLGPKAYLDLIRDAKKAVDIPVIASLNCVNARWWQEYAIQLRDSGADALEINLSLMPQRFDQDARALEDELISTFERIRDLIQLPVAVKIGPYFSSLPELSVRLRRAGADALVLFNRFYQYDFDLATGASKGRLNLTNERDYGMALRWISILFDRCGTQLSASTGIHSGETALKMIAAGADSVQLCSVLYRSNIDMVKTILADMERLLSAMNVSSVEDLRGRYSQKGSKNPESMERLQYIKALTGVS